jgi:N-acetyl-gamma-glutamyl-phosphate reductase
MKCKIFVDGQEGTTGLRIHEYLSKRDDVELLQIPSEKRKDVEARRDFINRSDVTFLCLPDTASMESAALVENKKTCVIDASTAFRTHGDWAYGLPELFKGQREVIRNSKKITVPGCHATAFVLSVHPLVRLGILQPDYPTTCFSVTGYSGGGKKLIETYEVRHTPALESPRHYALGLSHKHLPEMQVRSGLSQAPVFCPVVGDFFKGLAVTVFLHPGRLAQKVSPRDIQGLLADYYRGERFVQVKSYGQDSENLDNGFFDVQACNDTNRADIFVFGNEESVALITRLDNLGKGASGAAVQSMNVHLGIDETKGLE